MTINLLPGLLFLYSDHSGYSKAQENYHFKQPLFLIENYGACFLNNYVHFAILLWFIFLSFAYEIGHLVKC